MNIPVTVVTIMGESERRGCNGHGLIQQDLGQKKLAQFPWKDGRGIYITGITALSVYVGQGLQSDSLSAQSWSAVIKQ